MKRLIHFIVTFSIIIISGLIADMMYRNGVTNYNYYWLLGLFTGFVYEMISGIIISRFFGGIANRKWCD